MAYTYSSYAGSLRPESSLPTIEEGLSHLQDSSNSEDAIHQLRNQQHIIHSPKNSNFLPPGHQSPTTRIVSGGSSSSGTAVDRISADGKPPRSRHGTADSLISNGSNISLNESELFRGAQYALAHLQESIHSQEQEITATSVALSQHYRHAHLDRTERIEDANLTGISQVPKTPGSTTRRTYGNDMVESPSLPSSLRNALATPRSKSVTFAPSPPGSPSPAQQQDAASELSAGSEPEIDGLSTSEQAMLSEWTRIPPSESSPPSSRSIARNSPRRSPSPLDAPIQQRTEPELEPEAEVESQFAVESSPSPSPRSSSALLRTNRRSISPSLHTSVAHTPSRLRNVVTLTDTESSLDSNHAPEEEDEDLSHERTPPPSRPSSRQAHSSPHRLSRTPVQSLPQPSAAFLPIPFSSPLAQSLTQAKSPATLTGISTGTAVTAGTGTFATAESFQTTPSSTGTRTSTLSGTKEAGDSHELLQGLPPPRFPSLFGADTSFSVERDEEPVIEEEEQKEELKEEEEEDEMVRSIEDSLSRLTRAAQLISSATASAFAQIGGRRAADTEIQDKLEEEEEAAGETSQTIEELAHGANLVQEMHELHAALQANLLRRLQAAERGQAREREERVQLEGNVKRLVVGLMKGDSVSGEEDGALAEEGEEMEMLFGKFRAWALHMGSMKDRLENSNSVGPEPASTSRSSNSKTETDRLLSLQSELDRLSAELEIAEQAHLTIQARVAEVESERDELKDEQGVFELELSNARRERDQLRSEAEDVAEELSLAQRRISVLEVQVAEESAGRSQADAYRRRLEEGFEAQLADLRRELEDLRRENVKLEEGRRQVEERGREEVGGAVRALREREREVEKLLSDLETERQIRARLEGEREELIAAIPIPDEKDDEDQEALLASKLEEAEGKVGLQASRIKELEKESANADLEIAKLLKVRDRMEQENANYAMALAAKQQELSLLKRNTGRTSAANMTTATAAATPLGLKTPRANDRHRQDQADPLSTVRRRPPTAVLQSLILNTETPLPSSRIAHRSRMSGLHQASSGKEDAYTTTTEEEEERSEVGDEVTPLRAGQGLTKGSRVLGERGGVPTTSSSNGAGSKARLSSRASLGSAVRASRVGVNDENAPPPPPLPSRGSSATSSTGTSLNGGGGARRARSSLGAGAHSSTATTSAAATRASAVGARRTSLGVAGNLSSRTERPPPPPSRAIAPSPTPSMASVTSTSSVASSGYTSTSTSNSIASTSTRTGVLRSAAAARKSGVGVDSRMMASTPTPASASASGSGRGASSGSVLGRERIVNRPRESGVRGASGSSSSVRASGSKAATTSAGPSFSSARTALKRSSPDEEPEPIKAIPQQQHHHSASASAASSSSRSTVVPRLSRTQQLGASSLSTHSLSQSSRSVSNGSVRDEEMTEEELSGSVGPMMPSVSGGGASLGARRVVSGRLSDVASSRAGPSGLRPGSSVPGGARRPSYGLAGSAARVPSYERRMLPA
ncbi:hypothetical protein CF319_g3193 [Tilletia indica]|nr:hypothetical protein CF319_g3193 [Tilletia indica]